MLLFDMTESEARTIESKVALFRKFYEKREELFKLMRELTEGDPDGPCGQDPFTGNTRETRRVNAITIEFSKTLGGDPEVKYHYSGFSISAYDLGQFLKLRVQDGIETLTKEIEKL